MQDVKTNPIVFFDIALGGRSAALIPLITNCAKQELEIYIDEPLQNTL